MSGSQGRISKKVIFCVKTLARCLLGKSDGNHEKTPIGGNPPEILVCCIYVGWYRAYVFACRTDVCKRAYACIGIYIK
jgi:hypothetical protein